MSEIKLTDELEKELSKTTIEIIPTIGFRDTPESYTLVIHLASIELELHSTIRKAVFHRLVKWMCETVDVKLDFNMMGIMGGIANDHTVIGEYKQSAESIRYLYSIIKEDTIRSSGDIPISFCMGRSSHPFNTQMRSVIDLLKGLGMTTQKEGMLFICTDREEINRYTGAFSHSVIGERAIIGNNLPQRLVKPMIVKYDHENKIGHMVYIADDIPEILQIIFDYEYVDGCIEIKNAVYVRTANNTEIII